MGEVVDMDTGEEKFTIYQTKDEVSGLREMYPKARAVFQEGEKIEIKGSLFVVSEIIQNGLKLILLK